MRYDQDKQEYWAVGFFCCVGCAEAFRCEKHIGVRRWLELFAAEHFAWRGRISAAPPREYLAVLCGKHGGDMRAALAEFRGSPDVTIRRPVNIVRASYFLDQAQKAVVEQKERQRRALPPATVPRRAKTADFRSFLAKSQGTAAAAPPSN